jgi:ribosome-associated translation inhibitor RaiA
MKIQYQNLIPNNNIKNKIVNKCKANLHEINDDNFTFTIDTQKQNSDFVCTLFVKHSTKTILNIVCKGKGHDIEDAIQMCLTQLESKIRRHKIKIKKHLQNAEGLVNSRNKVNTINLSTEILNTEDFVDNFLEFSYTGDFNQKEAKNYWGTSNLEALAMTIEEAYMKMDLESLSFLVFISKDTGLISVLHKKPNGQIIAVRDLTLDPQKQDVKPQNTSVAKMISKLQSLQKPVATKNLRVVAKISTNTQKTSIESKQSKNQKTMAVSAPKTKATTSKFAASKVNPQQVKNTKPVAVNKLQSKGSNLQQSAKAVSIGKSLAKAKIQQKPKAVSKQVIAKTASIAKLTQKISKQVVKQDAKNNESKKAVKLQSQKAASKPATLSQAKAALPKPKLKLIVNNVKNQTSKIATPPKKITQKSGVKQSIVASIKKTQSIKRKA